MYQKYQRRWSVYESNRTNHQLRTHVRLCHRALLEFGIDWDSTDGSLVSLDLVLEYPPTYPDVLPEITFEEVDEDSGELSEEETETVLGQLRTTVSSCVRLYDPSYPQWIVVLDLVCE